MTDESFAIVIRDANSLASAMGHLAGIKPSQDRPYTVTIEQSDEDRSLKQNRLAFLWYKIRGVQTGHGMHHERAHCKLSIGCPIMCEDKAFNQFYEQALAPLTYEEQLDAMEFVPVTRLMKVKQFAEYLTQVDQESAEQGIVLPHPDDLYYDALMREADRRG